MNKEKLKFLKEKIDELSVAEIITHEQSVKAKEYFESKKSTTSVFVTLIAIGVLLIALGIITLFAINWDQISKEVKTFIAFIPLIISVAMVWKAHKENTKRWDIYTCIFSSIGIIATNSLISQIYQTQQEIQDILFMSMLMFLPIVFYIKSNFGVVIYGIGSTACVLMNCGEFDTTISSIIVLLPVVGFNIFCYINDRQSKLNLTLWIMNVISITALLFSENVLRIDVLIIYIYTVYLLSIILFGKDITFVKEIKAVGILVFFFFAISEWAVRFSSNLTFETDTLVLTIIIALAILLSKQYKDIEEMLIFAIIFLVQYAGMKSEPLWILINILLGLLGIYYILYGNKIKSYFVSMKGVTIVLTLIFIRFVTSELSFEEKSIIFLLLGAMFIASANYMKIRLKAGEKNAEQ